MSNEAACQLVHGVCTSEGLAVLELGPHAEKFCHKIANRTALLEILGIKPGESVLVEGKLPEDFLPT